MARRLLIGCRFVMRLLPFAILWFLLIISLLILVGAVTNRYRVLAVLSGSMEPAIAKGDLIVSVSQPTNMVHPGQIITFHMPGTPSALVTHRVIEMKPSNLGTIIHTKGDANDAPDPWNLQLMSEPAWRTVFVVPGIGYILEVLRRLGLGGILLIVIPLALGVMGLYRLWRRT